MSLKRTTVVSTILLGAILFHLSASAATVTVNSDATLRSAISGASSGDIVNFTSDITLTSSLPAVTVNMSFNGGNFALDGASLYSAFVIISGNVSIQNLTIRNTKATGGNAGGSADGGGGGGLGAGGALFVNAGASVTILDVAFTTNTAMGGNGRTAGANSGGGGGGGLNGGSGGNPPSGSGTGGIGGAGGSSPFFPGSGGTAGTAGGVGGGATNGGAGGAGTFGGGGGGGGAATSTFSGGAGGNGGFGGGGGGGGIGLVSGAASLGGLGAGNGGNGNNGNGQAGTGFGGAVFVVDGGTLLVKSSATLSFSGNTTVKGASPASPAPKQNLGNDIYINGTTNPLTFQIDAGTVTLNASTSTSTVGSIAGDGKIAKTGPGTLILSGTHAYTGSTTVSAGALLVTGTTATGSAVTVNTGGTLGGTGTVGGTVTVANGGTLSPGLTGVSIATLTTGAVTLNATSTFSVDLDGTTPSADKIASTGTVTCAGTLTVASATNASLGKVYTVVTGTSITGTFNGLANGATFAQQGRQFQIAYTSTSVTLTDVPNNAPVLASVTASPTSPAPGATVTFTVSASDPDGTTPVITFDYGDGSTGTSLTHVYANAGTFVATVTASDGTLTDTKQLTITVANADFNSDGFVGPMDKDTDGDGVPDSMEIALGTSPTDASDSPVNDTAAIKFRLENQKAKFSDAAGDVIEFKGVLHVPAGLDPVGQTLVVDAGGNVRKLVLDQRSGFTSDDLRFKLGAKLNTKRAREARFSLKLSGALLSNLILNAPKDDQSRPTQLSVHILFNGALLIQTKQLRYRK